MNTATWPRQRPALTGPAQQYYKLLEIIWFDAENSYVRKRPRIPNYYEIKFLINRRPIVTHPPSMSYWEKHMRAPPGVNTGL
jgi:hypothetical protein